MTFFQKMINHKLNTITTRELLSLANQYGISINQEEAAKVVQFLRGKNFNIFQEGDRRTILQSVAQICGPQTAKQLERLMNQFL